MAPSREKVLTYKEFICGFGAAAINITVTFPIHKIIFRQQLHGVKLASAIRQIHSEGVIYLYRGVLPPLLQKSISTSLMFGMYHKSNLYLSPYLSKSPYLMKFTSAMFAGSIEAILLPFERMQTLLQSSAFHNEVKHTPHLMKLIFKQYGIKEYYRGLTPVLLRNGPSSVVFFITRDEVINRIPHNLFSNNIYMTLIKDFLIGATIGAINSSMFFPMNVIKVNMQSKLGGSYESLFKITKQIYIERGRKLSSFYTGVSMNCTRSFISWGVAMLAYERLKLMFPE